MRTSLDILTAELRRLKATGTTSISVSAESLASLRRAVEKRAARLGGGEATAAAAVKSGAAEAAAARSPGAPVAPGRREAASRPSARDESAIATGSAAPAGSILPPPPVVGPLSGDRAARWAALRERVLNDPVCRAHVRPGKQVVFGVGPVDAALLFIGEAPGAEEENRGEPFVGPAGQLLTRMIAGMGLSRGQVYIGNIMNWRPEIPTGPEGVQWGNRPPTEDEMTYCLPYLRAQVEIVDPRLIVALGMTAAQGLLGFKSFRTLGEIRGRWHEFGGKPLMVTYHPSYILRNPTNRSKRMIWEDLLKVMERVDLPISAQQRNYFLEK